MAKRIACAADQAQRDALGQELDCANLLSDIEIAMLDADIARRRRALSREAEVLAKLQRGGEQIIKHVHIDNRHGGQAVVTDTFVKGDQPSEIGDQCHGAAAIEAGTAMLGYDPAGNGMPIAGREGEATVQDARRDKSGRSEGQ